MPELPTTDRPTLPPRKRTGFFASWASFFATEIRRFRRALTKENLTNFAKTMAWVVPLTLLIWVYAEREQQVKLPGVPVHLDVRSTDPNRVVRLIKPQEGMITVTLQGTQAQIDRLRNELQRPGDAGDLQIDVNPAGFAIGPQTVPTMQVIANNPRFASAGVSVLDSSVPGLTIFVDKLDEVEVPIIPPPDVPGLVSATFSPSTAKLRGPGSDLDELRRAGQLSAIAQINGLPVLNTPGQHPNITVPVLPPKDDPNLSVTPKTVTATLAVKEPDVKEDLINIPVLPLAPVTFLDRYRVEFGNQGIIPSIQVSGPPEVIRQLKSGQLRKPVAAVELGAEDIRNPQPKKPVFLYLPEGVRVTEPSASQTVAFKISDRG